MLSSVDNRRSVVAQHDEVRDVEFDYDEDEVVLIARLDEWPTDEFRAFLDEHGLNIRSGPKHIGRVYGAEVVIDDR